MKKIVTKDSLLQLLDCSPERKAQIVGRALVVLFNRQVEDEKTSNDTRHLNMRGFAPCDAYSGTLTAKYYLKHRRLLDWQLERWLAPTSKGYPRIAKYTRQLNEAANEKLQTV
jgi:hypothetical protein